MDVLHRRHTRKRFILQFVATAYTVPFPIIIGHSLEPMFGGSGGYGDHIYYMFAFCSRSPTGIPASIPVQIPKKVPDSI